mmetsp:Transcript_17299/g.47862  ORF Transcript_17299/g.47862 Transcript_17299/m.47862 type:complete len:298 (+) Transcript_17299:706-1599(+)
MPPRWRRRGGQRRGSGYASPCRCLLGVRQRLAHRGPAGHRRVPHRLYRGRLPRSGAGPSDAPLHSPVGGRLGLGGVAGVAAGEPRGRSRTVAVPPPHVLALRALLAHAWRRLPRALLRGACLPRWSAAAGGAFGNGLPTRHPCARPGRGGEREVRQGDPIRSARRRRLHDVASKGEAGYDEMRRGTTHRHFFFGTLGGGPRRRSWRGASWEDKRHEALHVGWCPTCLQRRFLRWKRTIQGSPREGPGRCAVHLGHRAHIWRHRPHRPLGAQEPAPGRWQRRWRWGRRGARGAVGRGP